jgi:ArsR family transcriptional regulator, arsenate/arsenite/antimonite-responsive transcriptional repressor
MEFDQAVGRLSALAHASRLAVFRLLVRAGPGGMSAGDIARTADITPSTLSTHLAILSQAGLIAARREGRSLIYSADYAGMRELLGFLVADCCAGRPEICEGIGEALCLL